MGALTTLRQARAAFGRLLSYLGTIWMLIGCILESWRKTVTVLPGAIHDEIFCLSSKTSDVVIDYLCSDIEQLGYVTRNVENYDCSIIIDFERQGIQANLRIDRIYKTFEVVARYEDETILPRIGGWDDALDYLEKLSNGM